MSYKMGASRLDAGNYSLASPMAGLSTWGYMLILDIYIYYYYFHCVLNFPKNKCPKFYNLEAEMKLNFDGPFFKIVTFEIQIWIETKCCHRKQNY